MQYNLKWYAHAGAAQHCAVSDSHVSSRRVVLQLDAPVSPRRPQPPENANASAGGGRAQPSAGTGAPAGSGAAAAAPPPVNYGLGVGLVAAPSTGAGGGGGGGGEIEGSGGEVPPSSHPVLEFGNSDSKRSVSVSGMPGMPGVSRMGTFDEKLHSSALAGSRVEVLMNIAPLVEACRPLLRKAFDGLQPTKYLLFWENLLSTLDKHFKGPTAMNKFIGDAFKPALKTAANDLDGLLRASIDLWRSFGEAHSDLTESQEMQISGLELSIYNKISDILQIHTQTERKLRRADDQRFFYRFFDLDSTKVAVEWFAKALRLHLACQYGLNLICKEQVFVNLIKTVCDCADNLPDGFVSDDEWDMFMKRYGPLKSCYHKVKGVCIPSWSRGEGQPERTGESAPWFLRNFTSESVDYWFRDVNNLDQEPKNVAIRL